MKKLFKRLMVWILIVLFFTGQANAFDIQFGYLGSKLIPYPEKILKDNPRNAWGALVTIPLGKSTSKQSITFNRQKISNVTSKDNTLIILGLMGAIVVLSIASGNDLIWE